MSEMFTVDWLESDRIEEVIALSRVEYTAHPRTQNAVAGPSQPALPAASARTSRIELNDKLSIMDSEIKDLDDQIARLHDLRKTLVAEKQIVLLDLQKTQGGGSTRTSSTLASSTKGKARRDEIDYFTQFEWSAGLKAKMKQVFNIDNFRLCQEAVCNANMDMRDIVCVMPTGGGKSLTYQLPALLMPGCTLVISPLIALMSDQIFHLQEAGVEAVMITGTTPDAERKAIEKRLKDMASGQGVKQPDIKLCYVTPEKISASKVFKACLTRLAEVRKLSRIVIDEAHCVSHMGHDFREDYLKLNILRKLFPSVPIMALSATCPPNVLRDLLKILQMPQIVNGKAADRTGTVYFSAPLYRANLHYTVLQKPANSQLHLKKMHQYILGNHKHHSGIIYCLTTKETMKVAKELRKMSNQQIKTGYYHSRMSAAEKEQIHADWRTGKVKVVCATIAFGMGIDKADVRFVLHHSISKSVDGFYQESGRAGRDGRDADCVLYYRPQDATRVSQMQDNIGRPDKLHAMLRFAQNTEVCRKVQFSQYFSVSADVDISAWTTADKDALEPCGHCDNCTRVPGTVVRRDVREAAWRILRVVDAVNRDCGSVTIAQLGDLARGAGGGTVKIPQRKGGKGKGKEDIPLDLDKIAGGKVELSKDDVERVCVHLLIEGYLEETCRHTSYNVNVYVRSTNLAMRVTRYSLGHIQQGKGPDIQCSFPEKGMAKQSSGGKPAESTSAAPGARKEIGTKQKQTRMSSASRYTDGDETISEDGSYSNEQEFIDDSDVEEVENGSAEWSHSLRDGSAPPAKRKLPPRTSARARKRQTIERHVDAVEDRSVIELSSD